MKEIIIRWNETVVTEVENEETGETERNYEKVQHHERFNLSDILEMHTYWKSVKITLIDGTMLETSEDECAIYFR